MPYDPELVEETRAWLVKAREDLRAADFLFTATPPLLALIAFECQQAAEKSLKGFLTWNSVPFRRTHNLEEVGEQCVAIDPSLAALVAASVKLSEYAWKYRYPDSPSGPPEQAARDALALARSVFAAILGRLPEAVRPVGDAP